MLLFLCECAARARTLAGGGEEAGWGAGGKVGKERQTMGKKPSPTRWAKSHASPVPRGVPRCSVRAAAGSSNVEHVVAVKRVENLCKGVVLGGIKIGLGPPFVVAGWGPYVGVRPGTAFPPVLHKVEVERELGVVTATFPPRSSPFPVPNWDVSHICVGPDLGKSKPII